MTTGTEPSAAMPDVGAERGADPTPRPPRPSVPRAAPIVLGLVAVVLVAAGFGLGVHPSNLHNGLIAVSFTAVGVVVVVKRPGHREGWLFVATGVAHALMFFGRQYGYSAADRPGGRPAAAWLAWLGIWPLALVLALTGVTLMCFPDGRLPSARWRPVLAAMVAAGAVLAATSALWPVEYADNHLAQPHPLAVGGLDTVQRGWDIAGHACYLLFQVAWVVCVVVRLRRARDDEARQLRWFAYALVTATVVMVVGLVTLRSPAAGVLAVPIVPLAAGVAIVRYRLYDIDLVIDKTLVVGAMAAAVTAVYVAVVTGVGRLLGVPAGGPRPVLPLLATAVVAVAFEPVRRRVQRRVDRLVYGDRPSPYEALARLSNQLDRKVHTHELFAGLASTVADGVGATQVTLWVGDGDELVAAASSPADGDLPDPTAAPALDSLGSDGRTHVRPIVHQGARRGAITFTKPPGDALTASEDRLLDDLVSQAGLVIDNVGLGVELQARLQQISLQAAELQAAGKRIVVAQDAARRRIERDLHDGAQQQLVTLALSLQTASRHASSAGDDRLAAEIEQARALLLDALAELREMARGIHPAILTDEGLDAALGFLAERASLPVRVDLQLDRRLPRDVEATAYFVVSEALTNAARHADASAIDVRGWVGDGRLRIEVVDDGRGGADVGRGSGLQGLVDRLATLDGKLTVVSPVGSGTKLVAEIPCA